MTRFFRAPRLIQLTVTLIFLEALAILFVFFALSLELLAGNYQSIYAQLFLMVISLAATVWIIKFGYELLNKKRWARSAAFFWQLLQAAAGAAALADQSGQGIIGSLLVLVAGAVIILLFSKPVIEQTND